MCFFAEFAIAHITFAISPYWEPEKKKGGTTAPLLQHSEQPHNGLSFCVLDAKTAEKVVAHPARTKRHRRRVGRARRREHEAVCFAAEFSDAELANDPPYACLHVHAFARVDFGVCNALPTTTADRVR